MSQVEKNITKVVFPNIPPMFTFTFPKKEKKSQAFFNIILLTLS